MSNNNNSGGQQISAILSGDLGSNTRSNTNNRRQSRRGSTAPIPMRLSATCNQLTTVSNEDYQRLQALEQEARNKGIDNLGLIMEGLSTGSNVRPALQEAAMTELRATAALPSPSPAVPPPAPVILPPPAPIWPPAVWSTATVQALPSPPPAPPAVWSTAPPPPPTVWTAPALPSPPPAGPSPRYTATGQSKHSFRPLTISRSRSRDRYNSNSNSSSSSRNRRRTRRTGGAPRPQPKPVANQMPQEQARNQNDFVRKILENSNNMSHVDRQNLAIAARIEYRKRLIAANSLLRLRMGCNSRGGYKKRTKRTKRRPKRRRHRRTIKK